MALLTDRTTRYLPLATFLAVLGTAGLVACSLSRGEARASGPAGPVFSHALHYGEEGLDCSSCHATYDTDDPGMPTRAQCMLCHAEIDADKEPSRRIDALFDGEVYRARHLSALDDEIVFSHATHALDESLCGTCHQGIEESEALDASVAVTMDQCIRCHESLDVPRDCSTCHTTLGPEGAPRSHAFDWKRTHGFVFRSGSEATADRCDLCHLERDCQNCHNSEAPEGHTNYWRRRAHGLTARMDRESCAVCHRTDSCDACHRSVQPRSHTAAWGDPRDLHCLSCHLSTTDQGCFACHQGTPSHVGTPQPPDHAPGMNCLQCHGVFAPLPHVHKGEDCTVCHR